MLREEILNGAVEGVRIGKKFSCGRKKIYKLANEHKSLFPETSAASLLGVVLGFCCMSHTEPVQL